MVDENVEIDERHVRVREHGRSAGQPITEPLYPPTEAEVLIEKQKKFAALGPDAIGACSHESEWHRFLNDNGYEFFGDEYYEYGDIGRVISIRVQSHLIGLKMIREGLASGKFSKPVKVVDRSIDLPVNIPEEKPWSFWNLFSWLKFWA